MLLNDPFHRTLSHSLPLPISPAGGVCEGERWSLMIFLWRMIYVPSASPMELCGHKEVWPTYNLTHTAHRIPWGINKI